MESDLGAIGLRAIVLRDIIRKDNSYLVLKDDDADEFLNGLNKPAHLTIIHRELVRKSLSVRCAG